jgi:hypothetical protein
MQLFHVFYTFGYVTMPFRKPKIQNRTTKQFLSIRKFLPNLTSLAYPEGQWAIAQSLKTYCSVIFSET